MTAYLNIRMRKYVLGYVTQNDAIRSKNSYIQSKLI